MSLATSSDASTAAAPPDEFTQVLFQLGTLATPEAAKLLATRSDAEAMHLLVQLNPALARSLLEHLPKEHRRRLTEAAPTAQRFQWLINPTYPPNSVGRLMQPPLGVLPATKRVDEAIAHLRQINTPAITYLYATDDQGRLSGVVVLRDLFLANADAPLSSFMIAPPFYLDPELPILEAMKQVVSRHYPVYPVCDSEGYIIGLVRGHALFESQAYVISAQSGTMVGVRAQERLSTHWLRSLGYRHPWLLFNLIVSMFSAGVVTLYQDAVRQLVILAVFLPVVAAQARNSGAQTMAVILRGLSTGEWVDLTPARVALKEGLLGLVNGIAIGLVGGLFIYLQATSQGSPHPERLALVLILAMGLGCTVSAVFGVAIPLGLRRLGADPALASSILLTTVATVASQALFLALAVWWVL